MCSTEAQCRLPKPHFSVGSTDHTLTPVITHLPPANLYSSRYKYTADLLSLEAHSSQSPTTCWPTYQTPINVAALLPYLQAFPDRDFAQYMHAGLTNGFHVGFAQERDRLRSHRRNHPSSCANPVVVDERIASELAAGRLLGPISQDKLPLIHTSPLGLVPKSHQTNRWRMIHDLSSPRDYSVNDGIPQELCSLRYASVDQAVSTIQQLGRSTQLIKLDIKDAYRIVPVHPSDYHLLGIEWRGNTYLDRALPFGLRSAPKIFNALADFISWILASTGIQFQLHYLDDFLFLVSPSSSKGKQMLTSVLEIFQQLGIPVALDKTEGPTTVLIFLGILIDTQNFELRLPRDKLQRLKELITRWSTKRFCSRTELESLVGHLSHAASVIRQGRVFLRQLFPLLSLDRAPHHYIRLNAGVRADLAWWNSFLQEWNGQSFFPPPHHSVEVVSDASGSFGCGAFSVGAGWFQIQWPLSWESTHITAKELLPVVMSAALWGHLWRLKRVRFVSDNTAVVSLLNSLTSNDKLLMHLLRCLSFYAAYHRFTFESTHIPGVRNTAADAISRNNITLFCSLCPHMQQVMIPQSAMNLLVTIQPDWGSQAWTTLFKSSLIEHSHHQHVLSTRQAGVGT